MSFSNSIKLHRSHLPVLALWPWCVKKKKNSYASCGVKSYLITQNSIFFYLSHLFYILTSFLPHIHPPLHLSCSRYDFVEVEDQSETSTIIWGRWCGQKAPPSLNSKTNLLRVTFKSDDYFVAKPGFKIYYSLLVRRIHLHSNTHTNTADDES